MSPESWEPLPVPPGPTPTAVISAGTADIQLGDALRTAASGRDRTAAEESCRDFIKLVQDARVAATPEEIAEGIAADSLPTAERAYIVQDMAIQHGNGLGRHLDVTADSWIRSTATGSEDEPSSVSVELAGRILGGTESYPIYGWVQVRCEVTWDEKSSGWRLSHYLDGGAGPPKPTLTEQERREFLRGNGWRQMAESEDGTR